MCYCEILAKLYSRKWKEALHIYEHVTPVLRERNWLSFRQRITKKKAQMVCKCIHGQASPYLAAFCLPTSQFTSGFSLRSDGRYQLYVPRTSTSMHRNSEFLSTVVLCGTACQSTCAYQTRHLRGPFQKEAKDVPLPHRLLTVRLLLRRV